MSRKDTYATAHQVLDRLADLEQPGPGVQNHDLWRRAVRNRLRTEHWDFLVETIDASPGIDPDELADTIRAAQPRPAGNHTGAADPSPMVAALEAEMARNAARARGEACPTCDGAYWLDPELQDDRTWGPAQPCPDCNDEARTA